MQLSINYASRRSEVWQWYWRAWRNGLWRTHLSVFIIVAISASLIIYDGPPMSIAALATVIAIGALPLVGMALFPMLTFKPQERTLLVNERGIETTVGTISGSVPWQDIQEVREDGDYLVIQGRNKNAFIVPPRAFQTAQAKSEFRDFVLGMVGDKAG